LGTMVVLQMLSIRVLGLHGPILPVEIVDQVGAVLEHHRWSFTVGASPGLSSSVLSFRPTISQPAPSVARRSRSSKYRGITSREPLQRVSPAIHLLLGGPTNLGDTVCKCSGNSKHEAQHNIWDFKPQRLQGVAQPTSQRTSVKRGGFPFIAASRDAHCPSVSFVGQCAFMLINFQKLSWCLENTGDTA
jgi:hypothetical protein